MSDLTDLEICKKIAEIEGVVIDHISQGNLFIVDNYESLLTGYDEHQEYNPLTDGALCFDLMVKYNVDVSHYIDGTVDAYIDFNNQGATDSDANKAICLAIIEASYNDQ